MNTHFKPYPGRSAAEALTLTRRIDGPWLAVRWNTEAEAASIVLVGDQRCPDMWRRVDAEQPVEAGKVADVNLTPLSEFGVFCTLYPHSRVMSVTRASISRARRYSHPAGGFWTWEGPRVQRVKIARTMVEVLKLAVKDCNTLGRVRS